MVFIDNKYIYIIIGENLQYNNKLYYIIVMYIINKFI